MWADEFRALVLRATWHEVADEIATWFPLDDGGGA